MTTTKTTPKKLPAKKTPAKKTTAKKPRVQRPADAYKLTCEYCGKSYWTDDYMENESAEMGVDGLCDKCWMDAPSNYVAQHDYGVKYEPICYREPDDYEGN